MLPGFVAVIIILGYLLYSNYHLQQTIAEMNAPIGAGSMPAGQSLDETFTIGGSAVYLPAGTVTSVGSNSVTLDTVYLPGESAGSSGFPAHFTVSTNADTRILASTNTPNAQQDSELQAYNERVVSLMKDPQKNKAALEHMLLPLPVKTTAISLSDIKVGDRLSIQGAGSAGSYTALRIVRLSPDTASAAE